MDVYVQSINFFAAVTPWFGGLALFMALANWLEDR
jgi:hypothetical protein